MIFQNYPMIHGPSAQNGGEPRGEGFTMILRGTHPAPEWLPRAVAGERQPCIEACTATDEEISNRAVAGEWEFDVIDEYTTRFWFSDRESFRLAWRMARQICKGWKVPALRPDEIANVSGVAFERLGQVEVVDVRGLAVEPSSHHVAEAA